ncbi:hypothetical protein ACCO45_003742 [Purpureocillium lilacinum]|uniref:Uncharacterized protein n=1 Tax=Purpureocillium lilacinum TaxID=33203 RepID=A0ACC4E399_PURLI
MLLPPRTEEAPERLSATRRRQLRHVVIPAALLRQAQEKNRLPKLRRGSWRRRSPRAHAVTQPSSFSPALIEVRRSSSATRRRRQPSPLSCLPSRADVLRPASNLATASPAPICANAFVTLARLRALTTSTSSHKFALAAVVQLQTLRSRLNRGRRPNKTHLDAVAKDKPINLLAAPEPRVLLASEKAFVVVCPAVTAAAAAAE